jgi:hypothetical protein
MIQWVGGRSLSEYLTPATSVDGVGGKPYQLSVFADISSLM